MPNGKKGKFTAELLYAPGFEIRVEKLPFTVNGAQGRYEWNSLHPQA